MRKLILGSVGLLLVMSASSRVIVPGSCDYDSDLRDR